MAYRHLTNPHIKHLKVSDPIDYKQKNYLFTNLPPLVRKKIYRETQYLTSTDLMHLIAYSLDWRLFIDRQWKSQRTTKSLTPYTKCAKMSEMMFIKPNHRKVRMILKQIL